jgi:DNA topoisomerase-3
VLTVRLIIAEKPSVARAIAQALPFPQRRYRDYIRCEGGDIIAWCGGHVLEPVMPKQYDRKYARWDMKDLPIVPSEWKLRASIPELLSVLKMFLRAATRVVHAGDPDREGQLLVDEVLEYAHYRGPVDRLLLRDLSPAAVERALSALEPNAKYQPIGQAALARQRADWLYGINMTRAYSLLGQAAGYRALLSVGRVQTPLLGVIVARDLAIENFAPKAYFVVTATARTVGGETFPVRWAPERREGPELDGEGRVVAEATARAALERADGVQGRVLRAQREDKVEGPPLPYCLADLQIEAARRLGWSAKAVLDGCQALYETHKLTSYPRSDCSHLPEGQFADAKDVLRAMARAVPELGALVAGADVSRRSGAWNDSKVTVHHAIVPTGSGAEAAALGPVERALYDLIARRYIAQFLPPHRYAVTRLELDIAGERFVASGRSTLELGWRDVLSGTESDDKSEGAPSLPSLREGDVVTLTAATCARRESAPPKPFTDATLMHAMVHVADFVEDARVKAILTEADGLGTPATRPAVIETLFERGFIERRGKAIVSTPIGRSLITSLPASARTPDLTAEWEAAMRDVADGKLAVDAFVARTAQQLSVLIAHAKAQRVLPPLPPDLPADAQPRSGRTRRTRAPG